jgi:hypothetical protein
MPLPNGKARACDSIVYEVEGGPILTGEEGSRPALVTRGPAVPL